MWKQFVSALSMLVIMTVLTGLVYPLAMTGLAQMFMPFQANGSLVVRSGSPIGSKLIGQNFSSPAYFRGRPSAAGAGYDAADSGGSNLGPTNRMLIEAAVKRINAVRTENGVESSYPVPSDLATASASGLDPDITPAAAYLQAARVAGARGLEPAAVLKLVDDHVTVPLWGLFGEPRVNVLELNLALDDSIGQWR